jgi:hypothetical protein
MQAIKRGAMKVTEFPGSDDYGLLPEPGKIAEIASDPAIGGRLARTLEENVAAGIPSGLDRTGRHYTSL